jgi:TnpA family transposase
VLNQLTILSQGEIAKIYDLPKFEEEDRFIYFELTEAEKEALTAYGRIFTKIYFILQLGYFKAKQLFFVFETEQVFEDAEYIRLRYFSEHELKLDSKISKPVRLEQQKVILNLFEYQVVDEKLREGLITKAEKLARLYCNPVYIFRELMNYLEQNKTVLPGYSVMQRNIIAQALIKERLRLEALVTKLLTKEELRQLWYLLEDKSKGMYLLTWLLQEPSSFTCYQIRAQVSRKQQVEPLYKMAHKLMGELGISNENIRYYASMAQHYSVYKLVRMQRNMVYIYLMCFVYSRFRHINDSLVEAFKHYIRTYEKEADDYSTHTIYMYQLQGMTELVKVPQVLNLFIDERIKDSALFGNVRKTAFGIIDKNRFPSVSDYIANSKLDEKELKRIYYESIKNRISLNPRFIFLNLELKGMSGTGDLMQAIEFVKPILLQGKPLSKILAEEFPCLFIPNHLKKYLYKDGNLIIARYEFFMLQTISDRIESGDIYIPDSFVYKSFDQDLIPEKHWNQNREAILKSTELPKLQQKPSEVLADLQKKLEAKFKKVNQSILKGENKFFKIEDKKQGETVQWQLEYPKLTDTVNHEIFSQFPTQNISGLMNMVHKQTGFINEFTHILGENKGSKLPKEPLIATILALGTNHGIRKMAQISDINASQLNAALNNFIRNETLDKANAKIVNATARLPMFPYYNVEEDTLHSSSDGQKFGIKFETLNAQHSPKYFGLGKGISDYTMVANHIPVNAKIIGSHEHESYFVFDLLFNNHTDVKPQIHSTDTDGTNQVNFAILDFFGYQFAPRYSSFTSRAKFLYTFQSPSEYPKNYLLQSVRKINVKLIEEEWDNILRIIASLALKTTTQSTIIKKLSSYTRNNRTQQALIEYDKILKTLYLLEYIDSPGLRTNVQKALNRGEQYHQLKKHIFYVHGGKFRVHTVQEQQVITSCTRLIANVIIYYNTWLLSQLLEQYEQQGNTEALEKIKKISPAAWQHINVYGTYKFIGPPVSMDATVLLKNVKL